MAGHEATKESYPPRPLSSLLRGSPRRHTAVRGVCVYVRVCVSRPSGPAVVSLRLSGTAGLAPCPHTLSAAFLSQPPSLPRID